MIRFAQRYSAILLGLFFCQCAPEALTTVGKVNPDKGKIDTEEQSGLTDPNDDGNPNIIREVFSQSFAYAKYDLLWVIDNSGSMNYEANYVSTHITSFVETLQARRVLDYQMMVVNTDWRDTVWGRGQARGPVPIIKSTHLNPISEFQAAVADIHMCINGPCSSTNGGEMGLASATTALGLYPDLVRENANLVVIPISDEQDRSCNGYLSPTCNNGVPEQNSSWNYVPVDFYVNYFSTIKAPGTGGIGYYPVVGLNADDCSEIYSVGTRYVSVADGLGPEKAMVGSICESSIGESLARVAEKIRDNGLCFTVNSAPIPESIELKVNGNLVTTGYHLENGNRVCFDLAHIPPNESSIEISYLPQ